MEILEKVRQTERFENVIIIGDMNINLDPDSTDTSQLQNVLKDDLLDTFPLAGFKQMVNKCTRQVKDQAPSLLDHSWVKNMNKHVQTANYETESDHNMVVTTLKIKGIVRSMETKVKRNYTRFNLEDYKTDLLGMRWTKLYDIKDPTLIDTFITDTILQVLNEHAPLLKLKTGGKKYNEGNKLSERCLERIK